MNSQHLIDRFGRQHRYLRISVTDRCNFRCDYCMPKQGFSFQHPDRLLSDTEIIRLAQIFVSAGVTKIRLTGGEPMSRPGIEELICRLRLLEGLETLAMTTNGFYLKGRAQALKRAGLTGLNISIDSLKPDKFAEITGQPSFHKVMRGIEDAFSAGFKTLKLNVVIRLGINEDELLDFVALTEKLPVNIRFIEYMPFQGTDWHAEQVLSYLEMKQKIQKLYRIEPIPMETSAVSKDFKIEGHLGSIGFITSMTNSFCGTCDRLRLTSDGMLKTCLFQPAEINLQTFMRQGATDLEIRKIVLQALQSKPPAHVPMQELSQLQNNPMVAIGG